MFRALALATVVAGVSLLGGCAISPFMFLSPTECMTRVMYFESNRSSAEGMLAVGTVVMNRLHDPKFPNTVCGVVGQHNQFAPGVLWKPMSVDPTMFNHLEESFPGRAIRACRMPNSSTPRATASPTPTCTTC